MKNFITPHCHQGSLDTGSTPKAFVDREVELGTGYTCVTDHGSLGGCRDVFDLAKKANIKAILGLEAYFRDDDCPILKAAGIPKGQRYRNIETGSWKTPEEWAKIKAEEDRRKYILEEGFFSYWKYAHLTMHALDAEAYETMVRVLSKADARAERHGQERKPLFGWAELEELGAQNIVFGSGCLIGMVQRHLVNQGNVDVALRYYERLRGVVKPGNFIVEVFPHICTHYYQDKVVVDFDDGTSEAFPSWKKFRTNVDDIKADSLAKIFGTKANEHKQLLGVMTDRVMILRNPIKTMTGVRRDEGFVPNECKPWSPTGDYQLDCNRFMLACASKYGDPVLVSDDSHYAHPHEKVVQDVRLSAGGGSWRFHGHYHRQSSAEAYEYFKTQLGIPESLFESWVENSHAWASRFQNFGFKKRLSLPTKFYPENTLQHMFELIQKHNRMRWGDAKYEERLASELRLLHDNGTVDLLPYFFVAEEVCSLYRDKELLTGPGRGSAAGLLLAYVLGITHADPLRYGLSQERFLTLDRIKSGKLPDIDQDLPDRTLLDDPPHGGWLRQKFGDHFARISTDSKLSLRSAVENVTRMMHGGVPMEVEILKKKFLKPPQGVDDGMFVHGYKDDSGTEHPGSKEYDKALQEFMNKYPKEWEAVDLCLGLTHHKGQHACGYVICNEPVSNFIPLMTVKDSKKRDVLVTQYTAKSVEACGGLKNDYLVLKSLVDIQECLKLIQDGTWPHDCSECQRGACTNSGHWRFAIPGTNVTLDGIQVPSFRLVPFEGRLYDIWDLPEDSSVYEDICHGRTETVFQFNTPGARKWLQYFKDINPQKGRWPLQNILDLAAFAALDRPGPLDAYVSAPGDEGQGKGNLEKLTIILNDREAGVTRREDAPRFNMLQEYARRARGETPNEAIPILDQLLPETYGIMVYQEQLEHVFRVLGKTTAQEACDFRVHVSKKMPPEIAKDKAIFMKGAVDVLGAAAAESLWSKMQTFGQYGFNKSHAVCYSIIGYACSWLKHHYPQQWWAAVLSNAKKNEVNENFWPYCGKLVLMPDIKKSGSDFRVEGKFIRAPLSFLTGIGDKAHEQLLAGMPYTDIQDFCNKIQAFKVAGGKHVTKVLKSGKKVEGLQLATSALNRRVVNTLIVAGCMDSLFPEGMPLYEQLTTYERALAISSGKNPQKAVAVDTKRYGVMNALLRFQMRKAVLPAYGENLLPKMVALGVQDIISDSNGQNYFRTWRKSNGQLVPAKDWELVDGLTMASLVESESLHEVAVAAYVKSTRTFNNSGGPQGTKKNMEMVLSVEGFDFPVVKWSDKQTGRLETKYASASLNGAIVIAMLTKFASNMNYSVSDIFVVQYPMELESSESSSATEK